MWLRLFSKCPCHAGDLHWGRLLAARLFVEKKLLDAPSGGAASKLHNCCIVMTEKASGPVCGDIWKMAHKDSAVKRWQIIRRCVFQLETISMQRLWFFFQTGRVLQFHLLLDFFLIYFPKWTYLAFTLSWGITVINNQYEKFMILQLCFLLYSDYELWPITTLKMKKTRLEHSFFLTDMLPVNI